jgi:small GTP-binding protein
MNNPKDSTVINVLQKLLSTPNFAYYPSFIDDLFSLVKTLQQSLNKEFTFLIVGRTGVGKSSTINSLLGEKIAPEGKYDPTTMEVKCYKHEINRIKFKIFDSPGLCDEIPEKGNDKKYINQIHDEVKQIDSLLFITRLDDSRVTADEMRGIKLISQAFTPKVWEYSVIVLTRADKSDDYLQDLEERGKRIKKEIARYTGDEIASLIPVVGVDNKSTTKITPDGKRWLEELYTQVFKKMSDSGAVSFLLATSKRINKNSKNQKKHHPINKSKQASTIDNDNVSDFDFNKQQKKDIKSKLFSAVPILETIGNLVGSIFGLGSIGSRIGGWVGEGIDFIFSWFF